MDLFEEIVRMRKAGLRGALATIVHTNGSIPSYESSRMLVREDGSIAGTIGGGCVEADVWAAAKEVLAKETPRKMAEEFEIRAMRFTKPFPHVGFLFLAQRHNRIDSHRPAGRQVAGDERKER